MQAHPNPAHRQQVLRWAQNLMERGFYVLDTETTGLGRRDEIVQIAIVDRDGNTAMDELVRPTIPIPFGASRVHHICDRHVEAAPDFSYIYIELSKLLAGQVVVAYNMDFDWRMLRQSSAKYGLPDIRLGRRDCAMKQYARYKGIRSGRRRGYSWHKLGDAVAQEGCQVVNAHNALGDAQMTLTLIQRMAQMG